MKSSSNILEFTNNDLIIKCSVEFVLGSNFNP